MKFQENPAENFQENRQNPIYIWTYFGPIRGQKRPNNLAHRGHFPHTPAWQYPQYVCKPSVIVLYLTSFEKMSKNQWNKLEAEHQNSSRTNFLGSIVVHMQAKYQED